MLSRVPPSPARPSFCGQTERVSTPRIVKDRKPTPNADRIKKRILETCFLFLIRCTKAKAANPSFPLSAVTKLIVNAHFFGPDLFYVKQILWLRKFYDPEQSLLQSIQ